VTTGLYRQTLIATLGTHPQVVTLAADLLAEDQGVVVDEVHVIHTAPEGFVGEALEQLRKEFDRNRYRGRRCTYHEIPIRTPEGDPVRDIRTKRDAESAFNTIYHTVRAQKQEGKRVHLSIAGGRNSMVVYGAVTAHMFFDPTDSLWHILSTTAFERSGLMHRQDSRDASLVPIPVLPWSDISPALTYLVREEDPFRAVEAQERMVELQANRERREFLTEELTPAEWRVLGDYVMHAGTDREIALRLGISHRTVGTHLSRIYDKMRMFFNYDPAAVGRATLMHQFASFLKDHPELRSPPED
jgi:CRISPR-associated Csx14 family protein